MSSALRRATSATIVGAVLALGACSSDRASLLEPIGAPSVNFVISNAGDTIPNGTVAKAGTGTTASYTIQLRLLESLPNHVYQVWLGKRNAETGAVTDWRAATGTIAVTVPDGPDENTARDTLEQQTPGSFFSQGGRGGIARLVVDSASIGEPLFQYNFVMVSIEAAPGAATPSELARPLFATIGTAASTSFQFGYFDNTATPYVYVPAGRGLGSFRDGVFITNDSSLTRPPRGYFYSASLVSLDTAVSGSPVLTDSTVIIGDLMLPTRSGSLRDADVEEIPGVVQSSPAQILAAYTRLEAEDVERLASRAKPFANLMQFRITLESKYGDPATISEAVIVRGNVPAAVSTPPEETGEEEN